MKDKHDKGFSPSRIEDHARTSHVVDRAKAVTNSALGQATDKLGTPGGSSGGTL